MRKLLGVALGLALAGCVQTGVRYLDNHTAVISARGNGFSKPDQVQRSMMERAAALAKERGYTHFAIRGSRDTTSTGAYRMPSTATTNGAFAAQPLAGGTVIGAYSQQTTYQPGAVIPIVYPGMDVVVELFNAADAPPGSFLAADFAKKR